MHPHKNANLCTKAMTHTCSIFILQINGQKHEMIHTTNYHINQWPKVCTSVSSHHKMHVPCRSSKSTYPIDKCSTIPTYEARGK